MAGQSADDTTSIRALERGFEIIETLREHGSLSLTELATELEMPTSTAHVYLQTLEREGLLVREDRQYRNGLQFLRYGGYVQQQFELYKASKQVLSSLAVRTGERIALGVEERGQRVLLHLVDGTNAVSDNVPVGEFTDMHWTSLGKCLLAYLPDDRTEEILADSDLARATANTITDRDALDRELGAIRERGYSIEDEERKEGIRSIAVPILTPEDTVIGSIGMTGPTNRFDAAQLSTYVPLLEDKANIIKLRVAYY